MVYALIVSTDSSTIYKMREIEVGIIFFWKLRNERKYIDVKDYEVENEGQKDPVRYRTANL